MNIEVKKEDGPLRMEGLLSPGSRRTESHGSHQSLDGFDQFRLSKAEVSARV